MSLKVSGGLDYMNLCQKDTIFLKFFQNHSHALPRFFLLEPSRAHCLLLFQGTCHFLGCLITIWVLVYPPHCSMSTRAESGVLTPCPQHPALTGSSRSTHWRKLGTIPNMWPQFTLAKEHLQEAGWHSHPVLTPLASRTTWSSSDLKEEPLTKFVIWNHYEASKSSNVDPGPHLS